ncbi:MAG: universal stress protein, partial [Bryobacteraceae bacterium]
ILILVLNFRLAYISLEDWASKPHSFWLWMPLAPILGGLFFLLVWIALEPVLPAWMRQRPPAVIPEAAPVVDLSIPIYRKILVPLDHSGRDRVAITHAAALARAHRAKLFLLHVEEGVTSQLYGPLSSTAEVEHGRQYFTGITSALEREGIEVDLSVVHSNSPRSEIVRYARSLRPDLIVMGAHGHKGLKDIILGNTINAVRHHLDIPILVVRNEHPHAP